MRNLIIMALCLVFTAFSNTTVKAQEASAATNNEVTTEPGQKMKTAIIYSSKHGTTEKVANMIADKIAETNDVTLIALNDNPTPDISGYEKVILGTSIYMGKPRDNMKNYTKNRQAAFDGKIIGLFICGGETRPDKQAEELKKAYPDYLHNMALAEGFMGGEYNLEKMGTMERKAIKMKAKIKESKSFLNYEAIDAFAIQMK